jgi:hypothetical protein
MKNPDTRPGTGTLPGYLSPTEAAKFADLPIGLQRPLTLYEEADMLAAGLDRKRIADMTPEALQNLADLIVAQSEIFLGS